VPSFLPITDVILSLNRHGFVTIESCSGLKKDHDGENPFGAYVCFDDECYHDVSAHLFTLADAAGWDPTFGAHGFDVLFHCMGEGESEVTDAWTRLETVAKELGEWLAEYRSLVEPEEGYYYYRFRKQRGLFSKNYSEEDRSLSGLIKELEKIDEEFYGDDDE
jgi:hypothetical protein